MKAALASLLCALLSFPFLTACAPQPEPLVFGQPAWSDGETSAYRVTNREGRIAGAALFRTGQAENGNWRLTREIDDAGSIERAVVEVRPPGYRPVYSHLTRAVQGGNQVVETEYTGATVDIALTNRRGATVYERVQAPSDIRDERTLLLILRALPLAQGYATRINSFLPVVGRVERVTVQVRHAETVIVPSGSYSAWLVELKTNQRTTTAWVARAAPFPLVKFIDGRSQATFELTGFESGGE